MVTIELNKGMQSGFAFSVMQGDKGSVKVRAIVPSEADGIDLSEATWTVLRKNGTTKGTDSVTAVEDSTSGLLTIDWTVPADATGTVGKLEFMFKATSSTTLVWQSGVYCARVDAALSVS